MEGLNSMESFTTSHGGMFEPSSTTMESFTNSDFQAASRNEGESVTLDMVSFTKLRKKNFVVRNLNILRNRVETNVNHFGYLHCRIKIVEEQSS